MDVKEIETAIAQLPPAEVAELAEWFADFHAQIWDRQLERGCERRGDWILCSRKQIRILSLVAVSLCEASGFAAILAALP